MHDRVAEDKNTKRCVLALSSSHSDLSVCVYDCVTEQFFLEAYNQKRGQAEAIFSMIEACLEQAGAGYSDLGYVVANRGPSSFTSVRVVLSAARGLGLSLDVPLHGVTSFDMGWNAFLSSQQTSSRRALPDQKGRAFVMLNSEKDSVFLQERCIDRDQQKEPFEADWDRASSLVDKDDVIVADPSLRKHGDKYFNENEVFYLENFSACRAIETYLAGYARHYPVEGREALMPLYMRGADVSTSKKTYRKMQ